MAAQRLSPGCSFALLLVLLGCSDPTAVPPETETSGSTEAKSDVTLVVGHNMLVDGEEKTQSVDIREGVSLSQVEAAFASIPWEREEYRTSLGVARPDNSAVRILRPRESGPTKLLQALWHSPENGRVVTRLSEPFESPDTALALLRAYFNHDQLGEMIAWPFEE